MGDLDLKLFGVWGSPYSKRVEIALNLKGIQYEYIEEDLQNKSPELLKYNPALKKVPILVHDGRAMAESQVIVEYLDDIWMDNPILPQHPYDKAMARFWAKFIDDKCLPSIFKTFWGPKEEQSKAEEEARENLSKLENKLKGNKFFGGMKIGYVDIVANVIAYWLDAIQEAAGKKILTKELYPLLFKWKYDLVNNKLVEEKLPPWERLVAFYQIRIEAAKAYQS